MKKVLKVSRPWKAVGIACLLAVLAAGSGVRADDTGGTNISIERVALFKNGLGYISAAVTPPAGSTDIKIKQLPVPAHGTFWVSYPEDMKVRTITTYLEEVKTPTPVRNIPELLQANSGRKVRIITGSDDLPVVEGVVVKIQPDIEPSEPISPYYMDIRSSSLVSYQPSRDISLVVVETKSGYVALNSNTIMRADFESGDIVTSTPYISKQPTIRLELENKAGGKEVGVSFLTRGITWAPSYLIDISDSVTARLSAKALVVNETADLRDIRLELVTGFPNIQFGEINSPVAMSQNLEGFLRALTTGRSEASTRGNMMTQQAVLSNTMAFADDFSAPVPGYSTAQEGVVTEDLFLYPVRDFTLARGETACLPLFTAEVPYKHLYIWKIPDKLGNDERYRYERNNNARETGEEVWHSCRLVNNMDMPWTTAAAEFVKDGRFTGQDICYYTAPGAETTIRVNRAMNVLAEEAEIELERQRNAASFHGYSHDLVRIKGELKLVNRMDKRAVLEITKDLSGEVLETAPRASDVPTAKGLQRVNPRHVLTWNIDLEAGQEKTLNYTYEVYVRN